MAEANNHQFLKRGGCQQPNTQYTIQAWLVSSEVLRSGYNIKLYVQCWTGEVVMVIYIKRIKLTQIE